MQIPRCLRSYFDPHVTIFCIFWLHECLIWILEFNSKSLFWCQSRQIFEVRAIEQRHHEFQPIHMPPHQFWPRYHSDGLSPVHVRFEFFSKQICNVEALICHFYKNIKTLTQIHFPWDAHIFRTCTIFYRHYKGLHQMRKDLVLCALQSTNGSANETVTFIESNETVTFIGRIHK